MQGTRGVGDRVQGIVWGNWGCERYIYIKGGPAQWARTLIECLGLGSSLLYDE
jgi:hypothetical protein